MNKLINILLIILVVICSIGSGYLCFNLGKQKGLEDALKLIEEANAESLLAPYLYKYGAAAFE